MIDFRILSLILLYAVVTGCGTSPDRARPADTSALASGQPQPSEESAVAEKAPPGVGTWMSPPVDDIPAMRIELLSSGAVRWGEGLDTFGPAHWQYDSIGQELRIFMPNLPTDMLPLFQDNASRGYSRFDSASRSVRTVFAPDSTRFFFAGYWFDRLTSSSDSASLPVQHN